MPCTTQVSMPAVQSSASLRSWVVFGGLVLLTAVLDWAQAILLPLAIAMLFTFLLNPAVTFLQRWIGRGTAALVVVTLTLSVLGLLGYGLSRQLSGLASDLPGYRQNIRTKIADVRKASRGGTVEKVQATLEEIKQEMQRGEPRPSAGPQRVTVVDDARPVLGLPTWFVAVLGPLGRASLIAVLVLFMLLEHRDLRDRLVGLIGLGHLATTTRALDEAGTRVSRYLLMQSLVNVLYGVGVGVGTWLLGVPYPLLWAALAAVLRFIPYVGPWIAAGVPILVTLAALPGWTHPLYVMALFVALELFTNLVLETWLYAGAAGVSQVALIVAVAFWTWLWGPAGMLVATPLTVCLVVLGKHVPGFQFIATAIADEPALPPDVRLYQRLLAKDQAEAWDQVEQYMKSDEAANVYDTLILPALNYCRRDRLEGRLSLEEERALVDAARALIDKLEGRESDDTAEPAASEDTPAQASRLAVLACPAHGAPDETALRMLAVVCRSLPVTIEIAPAAALIAGLGRTGPGPGPLAICIADLPPGAPSKTRRLIKRLRFTSPGTPILIGRWAPQVLTDNSRGALVLAGASSVATSIEETRDCLRDLVSTVRAASLTGETVTERGPTAGETTQSRIA